MYDIVGVAEPPESFYPGENDGELTFEYLGMTKKELEQKEKEFERKLPGYMTPGEKTQLWNVTKDHMYTDDFGDYLEGLDGSHFTNNQKRCIDIFKALTTIEAQLKKAQKDMIADTIPRLFRNIYEVTNQNGILIAHNSLACETDFTLIHEGANHTLYQKQ
jgi:hypothetical protein